MFKKANIKHLINRHGQSYNFKKSYVDEFQTTRISKEIGVIFGVYRETNSRIDENKSATRSYTQKKPMLLTDYDSYVVSEIKLDDIIVVNSKHFRVIDTLNIQEGNYAIDISLEVYDYV